MFKNALLLACLCSLSIPSHAGLLDKLKEINQKSEAFENQRQSEIDAELEKRRLEKESREEEKRRKRAEEEANKEAESEFGESSSSSSGLSYVESNTGGTGVGGGSSAGGAPVFMTGGSGSGASGLASSGGEKRIPDPEGGVTIELTEEMLDSKRKAERLLKRQQFQKAGDLYKSLPEGSLTNKERFIVMKIDMFKKIENLEKENNELFKPDNSLDEGTQKTVIRLYKGAQTAALDLNDNLVKDMLIQALYLDRAHYKSKKLLEFELGLKTGDYKIENIEAKYWKRSLTNFYSGYPAKALDDLKVLEAFDPTNPEIFKRMGSSYYSMGLVDDAIKSWKRALFFEPGNKELEGFIDNAKKEDKRQDAYVLQQIKRKKKKETGAEKVEMQTLRITDDANVAYSYAQEVRKQMKGVKVVVEETSDGKWAVRIPKKTTSKKE